MLFVFLEWHQTRQLLDRTGHGSKRLANLVGDGGGEPAQSGHALFCRHLLLQTAQIREILEIENIAAPLRITRTKGRDTNAQITLLAGGRTEINFLAEREPLRIGIVAWQPEIVVQLLQLFPA